MSQVTINQILEGSTVAARFLLSIPRQRDFRHIPDGVIQVRILKDRESDFAAVVASRAIESFELLGFSDDFAAIVGLASEMANHDVQTAPDGSRMIVTSATIRARFSQIAPVDEPLDLSEAQIACLATYANGEYENLAKVAQRSARLYDRALKQTGDSFFIYIMKELDPRSECDSVVIGEERANAAILDLTRIQQALAGTSKPVP